MHPTRNLADLEALMRRLRADCPWDKKQTNQSLIPYAIEEAYELGEAVQSGDLSEVKSELGDVLLQVVFHACLYGELDDHSSFDMGDVIYTLMEKLIRRHPHVFDADNLPDDEAVAIRWAEIKAEENADKPRRRLDAVKAGSALMQAQDLQKQAAKVGFDWDDVAGAKAKLTEEIAELDAAISTQNKAHIQDELGDCLFALVNVARKLDVSSEAALLGTIYKFRSRFAFIEDELEKRGSSPEAASLEDMDKLWDEAKTLSL